MGEILSRAMCFVGIILLGYILRKKGFFQESDFHTLSKVVLKITLPAAIVSSFAGKEIDPSMLFISAIGLGGGVLLLLVVFLVGGKQDREQTAFDMVNTAGYNIGNFTLPFVQSFLGPIGVMTTSLFDVGNAWICLGGAYGVADVIKGGDKFSIKRILKALTKSMAFDCYMIMILMNLLKIPMPSVVVSFADIIAGGNAFVAMLMIGVGFKLGGDMSQRKSIIRILCIRYSVSALLAAGCFFFLPFDLEIRQTLVLLMFSPLPSAAPAFTAELKGDTGLASAVNSLSIVCSIVIIVLLLLIML